MRDLVQNYLSKVISRRGFLDNMKNAGMTLAAAVGRSRAFSLYASHGHFNHNQVR